MVQAPSVGLGLVVEDKAFVHLFIASWSGEATASSHWKDHASTHPLSERVLPRQAPGQRCL